MLETIREYGLDCLRERGEVESCRQVHATYYLALAEQVELQLGGAEQVTWLEQLGQEHDNLRAAMRWSLEPDETGRRKEMALRLGGALRWFWLVRGHWSEGRRFLARALADSEGIAASVRAKALDAAARLADIQGDGDEKETLGMESLVLYRRLGDKLGLAHALYLLGGSTHDWEQPTPRDKLALAYTYTEEALALFQEVGFEEGASWSLCRLAKLTFRQGDYAEACTQMEEVLAQQRKLNNKRGVSAALFALAEMRLACRSDPATIRSLLEESLALGEELGDKEAIASSLYLLGELALSQADPATAQALLEGSLALCQEMEHQYVTARSCSTLAQVHACQGNYATASTLYEQSLGCYSALDDREGEARCLEGVAGVAAAQGALEWAARLLGAAGALHDPTGAPMFPVWRASHERAEAAARSQLDAQTFGIAWAEGRAAMLEQPLAASELLARCWVAAHEFLALARNRS
jgi:tetratricopeptide (TPR) repeat protein